MTISTKQPICPGVSVQLTGKDGNAFLVIGRVTRAMHLAGASDETIDAFTKEATSGDYDHLLRTCIKYVEVN